MDRDRHLNVTSRKNLPQLSDGVAKSIRQLFVSLMQILANISKLLKELVYADPGEKNICTVLIFAGLIRYLVGREVYEMIRILEERYRKGLKHFCPGHFKDSCVSAPRPEWLVGMEARRRNTEPVELEMFLSAVPTILPHLQSLI